MRNLSKPLLLATLLMLPACAATQPETPSPPIQPQPSTALQTPTSVTSLPLVCSEMQIVQLSINDTTGTKTQVETNNHVLTALCGK